MCSISGLPLFAPIMNTCNFFNKFLKISVINMRLKPTRYSSPTLQLYLIFTNNVLFMIISSLDC